MPGVSLRQAVARLLTIGFFDPLAWDAPWLLTGYPQSPHKMLWRGSSWAQTVVKPLPQSKEARHKIFCAFESGPCSSPPRIFWAVNRAVKTSSFKSKQCTNPAKIGTYPISHIAELRPAMREMGYVPISRARRGSGASRRRGRGRSCARVRCRCGRRCRGGRSARGARG